MKSLALVFLLCWNIGFAQSPDSIQLDRIMVGLNDYRQYILANSNKDIQYIKLLLRKLKESGIPKVRISSALNYISSEVWRHSKSGDEIRQSLREKYSATENIDLISDHELIIIANNSDLLELISDDVLDAQYPFRALKSNPWIDEIRFYGIKNGYVVGEIGAGSGQFSLLLSLIYNESSFYINEVSPKLLNRIKCKIEDLYEAEQQHIIPTMGSQKRINIEGEQLDIIFMRMAFHHFKKEKQMIKSVYNALKLGGLLIMQEIVTDNKSHKHFPCYYSVSDKYIRKKISRWGFELIDELRDGNLIIYKFKKS